MNRSAAAPVATPASVQGWMLLAMVLWGVNVSAVKALTASFEALPLAALRMAVACVALSAVVLWRRGGLPLLGARQLAAMAGCAFLMVYANQILFAHGLQRSTATNGALIMALSPLVSALMAALVFGEPLTPRRLLGVALGFAGVAAVVLSHPGATLSHAGLGDLMLALSVISFAVGGVGLILTESTAVDPRGRIGTADLGLWKDSQVAPLKAVVDFVHAQGGAIGVQLAHAGRKSGSEPLWEGGAALSAQTMAADEEPWERLGPSALAAGPGWSAPRALGLDEIEAVVQRFVDAARRADEAGFDVVELHFGHGYLVASFLSPNANRRDDAYGGSREKRMALALEIARRVRAAWPEHKPLFCRLSAVDGTLDGWSLDDSVVLSRALGDCGVDVIDCSSGGLTEETRALPVPRGLGFQVPFSARIRREAGVLTQAVGMIVDARQAEAVLAAGDADLVALGREALFDPYWAHHAAAELGVDPAYRRWPVRHGVWLAKRAPGLARARAEAAAASNDKETSTP